MRAAREAKDREKARSLREQLAPHEKPLLDLRRRPDRATERAEALLEEIDAQRSGLGRDDLPGEPELVPVPFELLPHVRATGAVLAEHVVMGQRVPEEVRAVDAALGKKFLGGAQHLFVRACAANAGHG